MKHLTIIASSIMLISSYSFAAEYGRHEANFNNNLSNDTITIFNIENGGPRPFGPKEHKPCLIGPNETQQIPLAVFRKIARINMTTTTMAETSWHLTFKDPLPQNITFTESSKRGPDYIDVLYDGNYHASIENKRREIIIKKMILDQIVC